MSPGAALGTEHELWRPHPDDDEDIGRALEAVSRGEILTLEASEAFVRWLEGTGDEAWRVELE